MLILSRRPKESIRIGDSIVVTVLEVRGDHVRVGIGAPRDVEVHRQEVYEAIQDANRLAASPTDQAIATLGRLVPARKESAGQESATGDGARGTATE